MSKHRKTWSQQEKMAVLEYQKIHGTTKAGRYYGVSNVSIGKWMRLFDLYGKDGLTGKKSIEPIRVDHEKLRLERENTALKAIVAEKELQLRIQAEMLKKVTN
jgi:hypothetical protein